MRSKGSGITRMAMATVLLAALVWPSLAVAEKYRIDEAHSFFMFRATRFGVANVYGRFNQFSGTLNLVDTNFEEASVEIEVRTRSVDTGNSQRDDHLRSPDFLNARQFPVFTFKSDSVRVLSQSRLELSGQFTLLGVTKPVTVQLDVVGLSENRGTRMIGFDGSFTIKRSDFGMNFMVGPLSDEIVIHLAVQALSG